MGDPGASGILGGGWGGWESCPGGVLSPHRILAQPRTGLDIEGSQLGLDPDPVSGELEHPGAGQSILEVWSIPEGQSILRGWSIPEAQSILRGWCIPGGSDHPEGSEHPRGPDHPRISEHHWGAGASEGSGACRGGAPCKETPACTPKPCCPHTSTAHSVTRCAHLAQLTHSGSSPNTSCPSLVHILEDTPAPALEHPLGPLTRGTHQPAAGRSTYEIYLGKSKPTKKKNNKEGGEG